MRLRKFLVAISLSALSIVIVSCGGGDSEDNTPAPAQPTATTSTGPAPTASVGATAVATTPSQVSGTIFERSSYSKYELTNIRYGGTYREATTHALGAIDPKLFAGTPIGTYTRLAGDKLVRSTPNEDNIFSHFEPALAESWTISTDLKTYTFKLRSGVKWHNIAPVNGRELTVDDVVFSLNRYREKDSVVLPSYQQIADVTAPDKSTVVITLKEPNAWAINDLFGNAEIVVAPEFVKENNNSLPDKIIGTGPYILKDFKFRTSSTWVRNPNFWQKDKAGNVLPYIDTFEYLVASEPGTLIAAMRTNQLDGGGLTPQYIANLANSNPEVRVYISAPATSDGIAFNVKKAPWSDIRVRRAWSLAFDRQRVAKTVNQTTWEFNGPMWWSLVSTEPFKYDDLGPWYKYDPEQAKKLLIEAGFADGKFKKPGVKLEFGASYIDRALAYQDVLKSNGIEFELNQLDNPQYQTKWFFRTYEDLTFNHWIAPDYTLAWFAQIKFHSGGPQNISFLEDPKIDETIKNIKSTSDPAKLREYAKVLWDFDTLNVNTIWAGQQQGYTVRSGRTKNYMIRVAPDGIRAFPWMTDAPRTTP